MAPEDIDREIVAAGFTKSGLARDLNVSPTVINDVVLKRKTSVRVQNHIAEAIGRAREFVFPETKTDKNGNAIRGRRKTRGLFTNQQ
jgi:hypothetical protein